MSNDIIDQIENGKLDVIEFLNGQDEQSIRNRMFKSDYLANLDLSQGGYIWDAIEPSTIEFAIAYFIQRQIINLAFPQTSYGDYLKKHAISKGITPKEAEPATGNLLVTGTPGTTIPIGSKFSTTIPEDSTTSPKYFTVTEAQVIGESGSITVPVTADTAGTSGNVLAGEINLNIQSIPGVLTVKNEQAFTSGLDDESDEALLTRLLERIQNPPSSGNKNDYIRWTKEVAGVEDVIVKPLWNGPGTVKVIIMGANGASIPDLVNEVKNYLDPSPDGSGDGKAPIGATVTVTTVESTIINVTIPNMLLEEGFVLTDTKSSITTAVKKYLLGVPAAGIVRIKDVESIINTVPGVLDFDSIKLNDGSTNIQISEEQKAALGEVLYI